ncbi:MAG: undecaprenyl-diphosphate phosphatase [Syntrophomonadaceae bacterium]|nr:undecaprenyl-diphosphate phosphatase [Syntrophomonadaceae bacterium]
MTVIQAIILGAVQGLTEFLPVSSSGHLVIFQNLLGLQNTPLAFDVLVHIGTLLAVFFAFWDDIAVLLRKPWSKLTFLIIIGCIPAAIAGFLLEPIFEQTFKSLLVVGIGLLITGAVLMLSERWATARPGLKEVQETTYWDALWVGLLQAIAIIPGISRSGSTISAGLLAGMERPFAARFSFLLSIPVILGAGLVELKDLGGHALASIPVASMAAGLLSAAFFGYIAIKVVLRLVNQGRLSVFSWYVWALGIVTLVMYLS